MFLDSNFCRFPEAYNLVDGLRPRGEALVSSPSTEQRLV